MWFNASRMHVWTRLKEESKGKTGIGLYPDGMVEHDGHVGQLLDKLDELGIADNTIVMYSTDNGAEKFTWPDGGTTRFRGEKGTNWEGGHRVPLMVRWPGVIKPGTIINDIIAHNDWLPTFAAAAGEPDIVEKMKKGYRANGKDWKIHLDGYNFLPYFKGETDEGPRDSYLYFFADGTLMAIRVKNFKVHFTKWEGNVVQGHRQELGWPMIINLRADPFEDAPFESEMYLRWMGDLMFIFVPIQDVIKEFFATIPDYPFQPGGALNPAGINYQTLKTREALERLKTLENLQAPRQ
jgi:arylsulfatase